MEPEVLEWKTTAQIDPKDANTPRIKRKKRNDSPVEIRQNLPRLPVSWKWVVLGELDIDISDGNYAEKYPKASNFIEEGIPFIRATNIGNNYLIVPNGLRYISPKLHDELQRGHLLLHDILIVTRGQIGKVAIVTEPFVNCNINAQIVRINTGNIFIPKFFMYALASNICQSQFVILKTGSTLHQLPIGQLRQLCIPLPPVPEQECIVERIESLFTQLDVGIAGLMRVQEALKRYKATVLKTACEGRLIPQNSSDEPSIELLKKFKIVPFEEDGLSRLPDGWCWVTINNLASKVTDGTHKTPQYVEDGIPFISVNNISFNGVINFLKTKFISLEEHNDLYKRCNPEKGDVLLTKVGTIGLTAVVSTDTVFSLFVNTALIKPINEIVDSNFLAFALRFGFLSNIYEAQISGSTQKFIGTTKIGKLYIPLPPLVEQHRIVAEIERRLSVVQELEQTIEANLKRAESSPPGNPQPGV